MKDAKKEKSMEKMASLPVVPTSPRWSQRARLYASAAGVAIIYFLVGRLSSDNPRWVQVDLPLSAASVLVFGLGVGEAVFAIQRWQRRYHELQAARAREIELADRLAEQRRNILNQISRALLNNLDMRQVPTELVERLALLFETDVVAVWIAEHTAEGLLAARGICGLSDAAAKELGTIGRVSPCFEKVLQEQRQIIIENLPHDAVPALAGFCKREGLITGAFTPIISRETVVGVVAAFYRQNRQIAAPLAAEMQTVANLFASAVQAEELYRNVAESQKIDSLGNLASGIAHDFNNILAATLSCVSYVKQHTESTNPSYRYLTAAETSIHRGAALSKQLLSFARREGPPTSILNPNDIVQSTLDLLERGFEKNQHILLRLAPNLRPVEINASQLEQVVLNLAINARDAMPHGGTLTVTTRNTRLDINSPERARLSLPEGDYVVLSFRDTGHGMDEAVQRRIFEPFFTTKPHGQGSGLGLALVQNIVQNAGGEILVESAPGHGALFEVFLPVSSKPLPAAGKPLAAEARGGCERILLAEDEDVIREMTALALESRGYTVITAPDGATALALYERDWKNIDLVIADMVMPHLSGVELLTRLKEINPAVRVIVSSGFSHELEGQQMLQSGCLGYLQKPYDTQALHRLVRSVLDSQVP